MANQAITVKVTATLENGLLKDSFEPDQVETGWPSQSTTYFPKNPTYVVWEVGITEEDLETVMDSNDLAAGGIMVFQNIDSTNYISFGDGPTIKIIGRIRPGEVAIFGNPGDPPWFIADTAPCRMIVMLYGGSL